MTVLDTLITDRTQEDVSRLRALASKGWEAMTPEEREEYLQETNRGAYNASDLNRVERAVQDLASALRSLPGELRAYAESRGVAWDELFAPPYDPEDYEGLVSKTWTAQDIPTSAELERYLGNVRKLREAMEYATDELPDSMARLTWQGANAIERALLGLRDAIETWPAKIYIDNIAAWTVYSGEIYSGEV